MLTIGLTGYGIWGDATGRPRSNLPVDVVGVEPNEIRRSKALAQKVIRTFDTTEAMLACGDIHIDGFINATPATTHLRSKNR